MSSYLSSMAAAAARNSGGSNNNSSANSSNYPSSNSANTPSTTSSSGAGSHPQMKEEHEPNSFINIDELPVSILRLGSVRLQSSA